MTPNPASFARLESLSNFRDVADAINKRTASPLRTGLFYRSARPDETNVHDRQALVETFKIRTILDLRTTTELLNAANKFDAQATQNSILSPPNDTLTTSYKMPGIRYVEINLNGKGFERALIWQLSYYGLAKVIGYMALGYRMEAVSIIGREVLQPRGLIGLALDTIEHSQPEIRALFDLLSREDQWPILIHCTQGKDRTGLSVILTLLLCHIDIEDITQDYIASEPESEEVLTERMKDTSSIGLDESFARCPRELPRRVKEHIDATYGSIEQYLQRIGVTEVQIQLIRKKLLQSPEKSMNSTVTGG